MRGYGFHWSKCRGGGGPDMSKAVKGAATVAVCVLVALIITEFMWYIAALAAGILAGLVLSVVIRRKYRAHAAMLEGTRAERLGTAAAPQLAQQAPPAIEQHVHYHYHGAADTVIPGRKELP